MGAKLTVFISSAVAVSSLFLLKSFGGRGVSNWRFIIGQSLLGACEVFSGGLAFEWMGIIFTLLGVSLNVYLGIGGTKVFSGVSGDCGPSSQGRHGNKIQGTLETKGYTSGFLRCILKTNGLRHITVNISCIYWRFI